MIGAPIAIITQTAHFAPSHTTQRHSTPPRVSHGLPRRSPSGRRRAHPHHCIGLISLISLMQASRPRNTHTAVAIKKPSTTPNGKSAPEPYQTAASKPTGYTVTLPYSSQKFPKIPKDSQRFPYSVTPTQTAYPRSHQSRYKKKRLGLCQTAVFKRAISLPPVEPAETSVPSAEFLPCREKVSFRRLRLKRRRSNQKAHSQVQLCSFHSRAA